MRVESVRPLRIVQVLHSHGYGGAETHALALMRGLASRGHKLVFAGPADSWLAAQCGAHGIELHPLRMTGLYDPVSHLKLRKLVREWRTDVVHGHLVRGSFYAGIAAAARGVASVSTAHATTARKHMRRSHHIIAVSEAVRASLLKAGYPDARLHVVHNGSGPAVQSDRDEIRREFGIPLDATAFVCVGRFVRDKGQDLLVEALRRVPQHERPLVNFVGDTDTDFGREVQDLARTVPEVRFLGYRADVLRILCAFDACVVPSRREALSLAAVEASSACLPLIAARTGGLPEVVLHEQTGLLVPPEDVHALAAAIRRVSTQAELRQTWGAAARSHYLHRFTIERMIDGTEAVYRSALEAAR
ncbi:glycosyltransferase family 4 protein [Schlegelella aquatica]|uniref:glycosyltransferase family 4 protein n=1 Tax=Caldimonas aquatica TaxID=376175 RepID=UPI00375125D8